MLKIIGCVILVLHLHFAVAQVMEGNILTPSTHGSNRRRPSDPVTTFLSGLGNLMLDIDETFARQTAPKVNAEDRTKEQMFGRPSSGTSYFNRIRENYRDIQRRLGESLGILDVSMSSDLGSVNVQNKNQESSVDVSLPLLPMKLSVSSNPGVKVSRKVEELTEAVTTKPEEVSPRFASNFKLGNTQVNIDSNLDTIRPSELLKTVEDQMAKTLEEMGLTNRRLEIAQPKDNLQEQTTIDSQEKENELNLVPEQLSVRSGSEVESSEPSQVDDSNPEGRILGDILYSESTFDKLTKRVMKDAKWAIDPKAFPSRAVEKLKRLSDKATENMGKVDNSKDEPSRKSEKATVAENQQKRENLRTDFKKRKSLKPLGNSLENTLSNENINFISQSDVKVDFNSVDSKRRHVIILAFTPEGVPLKLRMGPEIINPLKFLHKSLGTYGVSLNIPVMSYDDIEPVGREVLQLGTGSGGILTRALYIDLSDSFQLESLLRTLKSTKMFQEMQTEEADPEGV